MSYEQYINIFHANKARSKSKSKSIKDKKFTKINNINKMWLKACNQQMLECRIP